MFVCVPDQLYFPPVEDATGEGILAIGGDLSVERLLLAYRSGIFPWYDEHSPIIWWTPDPRFVLFPDRVKISRSMQRIVRSGRFHSTWNKNFRSVIRHCKQTRGPGRQNTWITPEMEAAYIELHEAGHAHSIEVWKDDQLAGGLYGVLVGRCFCGESMFSAVSNASKYALIALAEQAPTHGIQLIDSQVPNSHMTRMGAELIPRAEYLTYLT